MTIECRTCGKEFENLVLHVENSENHPSWKEYKTKYCNVETGIEGENNPKRLKIRKRFQKEVSYLSLTEVGGCQSVHCLSSV